MSKQKTSYSAAISIFALECIYLIPARLISFIFSIFRIDFFTHFGGWFESFAYAAGSILNQTPAEIITHPVPKENTATMFKILDWINE